MTAPTLTAALAARGLHHRAPTPADIATMRRTHPGLRAPHGRLVLRGDEVVTCGTAFEVWAWLRGAPEP
jgi:hypothetical protein